MKWTISRSRGKGPTSLRLPLDLGPTLHSMAPPTPPWPPWSPPTQLCGLPSLTQLPRNPTTPAGAVLPQQDLPSESQIANKALDCGAPSGGMPTLTRKVRGGLWGAASLEGPELLDPTNEASLRPGPSRAAAVCCPQVQSQRKLGPARAACSGHLAQARAAKAQSPPWVEAFGHHG